MDNFGRELNFNFSVLSFLIPHCSLQCLYTPLVEKSDLIFTMTYLPVGDMPGICCKRPIVRKNMFAYLRNCSYKNFGRKVMKVYFPVEMELFLNLSTCSLLMNIVLVSGSWTCWPCPPAELKTLMSVSASCFLSVTWWLIRLHMVHQLGINHFSVILSRRRDTITQT